MTQRCRFLRALRQGRACSIREFLTRGGNKRPTSQPWRSTFGREREPEVAGPNLASASTCSCDRPRPTTAQPLVLVTPHGGCRSRLVCVCVCVCLCVCVRVTRPNRPDCRREHTSTSTGQAHVLRSYLDCVYRLVRSRAWREMSCHAPGGLWRMEGWILALVGTERVPGLVWPGWGRILEIGAAWRQTRLTVTIRR